VAHAGADQNVSTNAIVTLDGSASSDANGDMLSYRWVLTDKPGGSTAALSSSDSAHPTFMADVAGIYTATLIVNDGQADSTAAIVTVTATTANAAPTANAGVDQNVTTGSTVTLDGSASNDANADVLSYRWTLTSKPDGSAAALALSESAYPTFVADVAGTYVASLIVNDGQVDSAAATVAVTVTDPVVPVTRIGTGYVATNGMTVTLVSFTSVDLGNGYTRYTATYKQENNTAVAIDEGTLRLYFVNPPAEAQYGFFGRVLPGADHALTRTYGWDVLSSATPLLLQYHEDHFFEQRPVSGALQWHFPIQ